MKYNQFIKTTLYIAIIGLTSCSPKLTTPLQLSPAISIAAPYNTQDLLPEQEIAFASFKSEPVEFFTPSVEISRSFNNFEKSNVRVKDTKLFQKRKELLINFTDIPEGSFSFPLPNAKVISPFGTRRGRNHTGIDLKTFANDTIRAAFDGIVRVANRGRGYGNVIVIRHYNGIETVYSHNSKNMVKSGDKVTAGMAIGLTGRTGRATTEHVHFETRVNGEYFDPNLIIDFQTHRLHNKNVVFTPDSRGTIKIDEV